MRPRYNWPRGTEPVRAVTGRKLHLRRLGTHFTLCGIQADEGTDRVLPRNKRSLSDMLEKCMTTFGQHNLELMFQLADATDRREGLQAYPRYHKLMQEISQRYTTPLETVVAMFVALSPNNSYLSNLKSLIALLVGKKMNIEVAEINTAAYGHCKLRAWTYLHGASFLKETQGPKIRNFYYNILTPNDGRYVTIDGHVAATWRGTTGTMKESIIRSPREYREIAMAIKQLAFRELLLPNQYQATLWFARKRVLNIVYQPQLDMLYGEHDAWRISHDIAGLESYVITQGWLKGH